MGAKKQANKKQPKKPDDKKQKKSDVLAAVMQATNKALGVSGAVFLGKSMPSRKKHTTGIAALDYVTGGGLKEGSLTQFTGGDSCFKTTAAMICCATAQEADPECWVVWVAGEEFDSAWAQKWGMDLDRTIVVVAVDGGTSLETACTLLETNTVALMVLDSYQSLGTEREMEGGVDSEAYAGGGAPQLWGRMMRRVYAAMNKGASARLIGISQVRAKIGGFSRNGPPPPEGSGIWALKHWKAQDVTFSRGEIEREGEDEKSDVRSIVFKIKNVKNKTSVPYRISSILVEHTKHGERVNNVDTLVKLGLKYGLINASGAWYSGFGIPRTQGLPAFVAKLKKDVEAVQALEEQVRETYAKG